MSRKGNMQKSGGIIGNPSIRIILLKTAVGYERKVYQDFKYFLDQANIDDWWAYKLFGEYDICFILKKKSLEQDLAYAGTIDGIIYSTELLCYLWGEGQELNFDRSHFDKPLIGINILKLKPPCLKEKNLKIEQALSDFLKVSPEIFCLGSFGWGEFVLMYPCESVKEIYDPFLQNILSIHLVDRNQRIGIFLKSFTLVGINYRILFPLDCSVLKNKENEFDNVLYPSLCVSCRPSEIDKIMQSLLKKLNLKNEMKLSLGAFDFMLDITEGTWGDFIERLLICREEHKEALFKTSVLISSLLKPPSSFDRVWLFDPFNIKILPDEAKELERLGHPAQESILSTVYTFNQYMQNELLADCVEDMIDYVLAMVRLTNDEKTYDNIEILKDLELMPENIKYGCNQRLSGFLLQEGVEDFSPFKGGKQRILKALKALCKDIFEALNIKWLGYVVIGRQYSYDHLANVLSIPVNAAFNVNEYFGLFHEIGHVVIRNKIYFEESPLPEHLTELFDQIGDLSREIFCDLFDFQCGFLGDYVLYTNTIPDYLAKMIRKIRKPSIDLIEQYVLRFLCVTLYQQKYPQNNIPINQIQSLSRKILNDFLKESDCSSIFQREINDLVSRLVFSVNEMKDVMLTFSDVYKRNWSVYCKERSKKLNSNQFRKQFIKIMNGQIVYDLEHPHLVVLAMLREKEKVPYRANVAAIQSFLNCYYKHDWDGTFSPYKKVTKQKKVS